MKRSRAVKVPMAPCPQCGTKLDRATCATHKGAFPKPGQLSVCCECAAVLIFTEGLGLRAAELNDLMGLSQRASFMIDEAQRLIKAKLRQRMGKAARG